MSMSVMALLDIMDLFIYLLKIIKIFLQMTIMFKCFYCQTGCSVFPDIINHLLEQHPQDEIRFIKHVDNKSKNVSYKVIPKLLL